MSQRLNSYFGASPELRQLSRQATELRTLQRHYEQFAPTALARSSHVLQLEQHILTLAADNGAVAAKLRVQVPRFAPNRSPAHVKMSAEGRKKLVESTVELPDSPLKRALQRLARNT